MLHSLQALSEAAALLSDSDTSPSSSPVADVDDYEMKSNVDGQPKQPDSRGKSSENRLKRRWNSENPDAFGLPLVKPIAVYPRSSVSPVLTPMEPKALVSLSNSTVPAVPTSWHEVKQSRGNLVTMEVTRAYASARDAVDQHFVRSLANAYNEDNVDKAAAMVIDQHFVRSLEEAPTTATTPATGPSPTEEDQAMQ